MWRWRMYLQSMFIMLLNLAVDGSVNHCWVLWKLPVSQYCLLSSLANNRHCKWHFKCRQGLRHLRGDQTAYGRIVKTIKVVVTFFFCVKLGGSQWAVRNCRFTSRWYQRTTVLIASSSVLLSGSLQWKPGAKRRWRPLDRAVQKSWFKN